MKKRWLWLTLALSLSAAGLYYGLPFCVAAPDITPPADSAVYDRHGKLLGFIPGNDGYHNQALTSLPNNLAKTLIAAEDKRFYQHGGVDILALLRAIKQHLTGESRSGASTISMQVAKMYSPPAPRRWDTKIREILQARRLEMCHSKEELLRAYLNRADFSNLCRGAECAAHFYFGKPASALTLEEAATLAAMVKAPTRLNPLHHPQATLQRRNLILQRLKAPTHAPLTTKRHPITAPPIANGLPGKLTLDASWQSQVADIAKYEIEKLSAHNVSQASVVVINNRTGEILVSLPVSHPESTRGGALDGTTTPRSAGSTLKPFVYAMAFSHGAWPGTILADVPTLYSNSQAIQAPRNYDEQYDGPITIRRALACSRNIPAMEALALYGGIDNLLILLNNLGLNIPGTADEYGLGLAIGNAHVTLTSLVQAYSTLARNGMHIPLQHRLPLQTASVSRILPAEHCYRISHILADPAARARAFGLAPHLSFPFPVAAKTGTSSNYRDNWCIGYTAEFTVGVWVGNFDNSPMDDISGVSGAGPIFHRVLSALHQSTAASFPAQPDNLRTITIDSRTGTPASHLIPQECQVSELATQQNVQNMPEASYDDRGRALLSTRYTEWLNNAGLDHLYALDADSPTGRTPAILIPSPNTTLRLDPTLPGQGRLLELQSSLPTNTTTWYSNTLPIIHRNGTWYAELHPGTHTIQAAAPGSPPAQSTFHVIEE